jgi:tetratricopeptide (TPR) repeat protein
MVNSLPTNKDAGQAKFSAEFNPQVSASEGVMDNNAGAGAGAGDRGTNVNVYNGNAPQRTGNSFSAKGMKMGLENLGIESLAGGAASAAQSLSKLISSLSQIDALANEAIRDVNEGVEAYKFLLEQGELQSATERLQETFALGEFMPSVRLLSRDDKRRALDYTQKSNELLAALEVNDLTRAEKLVHEIEGLAKDFDPSKPLAKIETAKSISSMHLAKARTAAVSGDKSAMERELRSAAEIWPRNPALAEVGNTISNQSDIQQTAMNDFDRLKSQKNYRQIYNDKMRFIAAAALYPEKQKELTDVLQHMGAVEGAMIKAREIAQRGDPAGAWESVEAAQKEFPGDSDLNQLRADLTTQAADFVQSLNQATEYEKKGQPGSALAWYLKARKKYPASQFAKEGIQRLIGQILPDSK